MEFRDRFAAELATFAARKAAWIDSGGEGRWVAIRGERPEGPFETYREVWRAGVERLGEPGTFMVKRVEREERPIVISHVRWKSQSTGA